MQLWHHSHLAAQQACQPNLTIKGYLKARGCRSYLSQAFCSPFDVEACALWNPACQRTPRLHSFAPLSCPLDTTALFQVPLLPWYELAAGRASFAYPLTVTLQPARSFAVHCFGCIVNFTPGSQASASHELAISHCEFKTRDILCD